MREVLISIQPKWVEKICRGEKTVEVRRTRPKCEVPFKCYIYCTMPKNKHDNLVLTPFGYDVGSESVYCNYKGNSNGKVIGEFVCDRIEEFSVPYPAYFGEIDSNTESIIKSACLKPMDIHAYNGTHQTYAWHITDLIVYDEPRELSEFEIVGCQGCRDKDTYHCKFHCFGRRRLKRPPQSWCYIEPRQTAD